MKKHLLLLIYLLVTISSLAQERLYTDKEHGGEFHQTDFMMGWPPQ